MTDFKLQRMGNLQMGEAAGFSPSDINCMQKRERSRIPKPCPTIVSTPHELGWTTVSMESKLTAASLSK